jgi:hypothetical protein
MTDGAIHLAALELVIVVCECELTQEQSLT